MTRPSVKRSRHFEMIESLSTLICLKTLLQIVPHQNATVDQSQGPGQRGCDTDSPEAEPVDGKKTAEGSADQLADAAENGVGAVAHARQSIAEGEHDAVDPEQTAHHRQILHCVNSRLTRIREMKLLLPRLITRQAAAL